jgi:hypothetical protein
MTVQQEVAKGRGLPQETEPAMNAQRFSYSPWRFVQVMLAIAWSAFAHPFSPTVIDLTTGRVYHGGPDEGQ